MRKVSLRTLKALKLGEVASTGQICDRCYCASRQAYMQKSISERYPCHLQSKVADC